MEVSAISALHPPSDVAQGKGNKTGSTNFSEHLEKQLAASMEQSVTINQTDRVVPSRMVTLEIDQDDERAATAELLRFYKMLMSGKIDTGALNNTDTNHNMADGPNRKTLETLKAVIRRLIGMQGAENDNMNNFSVRELIKQLPDGVKDLLKKVFPDLEELLLKDENKLAAPLKA